MSEGSAVLGPTEDDVTKMLMAKVHLGTKNLTSYMKPYAFKRKPDGTYIINLQKTWEKLLLTARMIVAIENPKDVCAISGKPYGTRAVLKFAGETGASSIAGRFTPGQFTNQIQRAFSEPRLLICTDPRIDAQPIREASYVNMPVVALADTDCSLRYIDVAIPCNNKSVHSIGLMWWFLARETKRMRGDLLRPNMDGFAEQEPFPMPDLFFYRDPEEAEKDEAEARAKAEKEAAAEESAQWGGGDPAAAAVAPGAQSAVAPGAQSTVAPGAEDWTASGTVPQQVVQQAPVQTSYVGPEEWAATPAGGTSTGGAEWASSGGADWS